MTSSIAIGIQGDMSHLVCSNLVCNSPVTQSDRSKDSLFYESRDNLAKFKIVNLYQGI